MMNTYLFKVHRKLKMKQMPFTMTILGSLAKDQGPTSMPTTSSTMKVPTFKLISIGKMHISILLTHRDSG